MKAVSTGTVSEYAQVGKFFCFSSDREAPSACCLFCVGGLYTYIYNTSCVFFSVCGA